MHGAAYCLTHKLEVHLCCPLNTRCPRYRFLRNIAHFPLFGLFFICADDLTSWVAKLRFQSRLECISVLLNDHPLVQEMLPCGFSDMGLPVKKTCMWAHISTKGSLISNLISKYVALEKLVDVINTLHAFSIISNPLTNSRSWTETGDHKEFFPLSHEVRYSWLTVTSGTTISLLPVCLLQLFSCPRQINGLWSRRAGDKSNKWATSKRGAH